MPAVPGDDARRDDGGNIIGSLKALCAEPASNQRDADANGRGERGEHIAAMMPGIGLDGGTFHCVGFAEDKPEKRFLDNNDNEQNDEGKGPWRSVRMHDSRDRGDGDPDRGEQKQRGDDSRGEGFGLAVAIRMVFIGGLSSDDESAPDDNRAEQIGQGFDGIGDQSMRLAGNAREELGRDQDGIDRQADKGGAQAPSESGISHGEKLLRGATEMKWEVG